MFVPARTRATSPPLTGLQGTRTAAAAIHTRQALSRRLMGDMGAPRASSVHRVAARSRFSMVPMRGLGDVTCSIDPTTGGRVCTRLEWLYCVISFRHINT